MDATRQFVFDTVSRTMTTVTESVQALELVLGDDLPEAPGLTNAEATRA